MSAVTPSHCPPRCASCGGIVGSDGAVCFGTEYADGRVDYRDGHVVCGACLKAMQGSAEGLEAARRRIERSLTWRGNA